VGLLPGGQGVRGKLEAGGMCHTFDHGKEIDTRSVDHV
jgi:hypothetical protein